ncbi:MAG: 50S ribosomal protein L25 [PVC group bacterium]|nr:50S ribosomal protein L25 [PVC group bacterium]
MERAVLNAEIRSEAGKSAARKFRGQGLIPGVVYAKDKEPVPVSTNSREFVKLLHKYGENAIIDLKVKKEDKTLDKNVIIKEIQYNTLKGDVLHIDFQQIKLTESIKVNVPLVTKGDADCPGVKEGGILEHILREVEVECLPTQIPHEITIDVAALNINDSIHVKDLVVPEGVKITTEAEKIAVLVKFEAEKIEEEEKPEEEGAAAEPEVINQKKPEEGSAEEKK